MRVCHDADGCWEEQPPLVGIDRRKDVRRQVVCRMLGIRADEAEKQARSPMYGEWITTRLAELDNHYRTLPPVRTGSGGNGAPELSRQQMENRLVEIFGLCCWGCDFTAPDERYLELENIRSRPADGANRLENRALLCRPCSLEKSGRRTLAALQSANRRAGRLGSGNHPIDLKLAAKQCLAGLE